MADEKEIEIDPNTGYPVGTKLGTDGHPVTEVKEAPVEPSKVEEVKSEEPAKEPETLEKKPVEKLVEEVKAPEEKEPADEPKKELTPEEKALQADIEGIKVKIKEFIEVLVNSEFTLEALNFSDELFRDCMKIKIGSSKQWQEINNEQIALNKKFNALKGKELVKLDFKNEKTA